MTVWRTPHLLNLPIASLFERVSSQESEDHLEYLDIHPGEP